ncbi:DUF885 domain-containing protein [Nakamurella endophytica]|uniref:DUF885 domain-containing protein n=1 Tax=Nakamurella endophytica TaxID=1748367 RepID=A0A917SMH8_9ACTN|nr:DUF885 domain-containing protein [Nakamurella endophytica]GGL87060.1 hypothetical protein GCM10011594_03300 [Nakamurella endophytica]
MDVRQPGSAAVAGPDVVREYVRLGLRFGRLVDGFVDAYTGDPALAREVDDEPAPDAAGLAARAQELVRALPDAGLPEPRQSFLRSHLSALAVAGRRLAGDELSFVDEVEAYFDVRIEPTDPDVYAAAHDRLGELLGGSRTVAERMARFRAAEACPPDQVERAVRAVAAALRPEVVRRAGLPDGEHVDFEIERDVAWSGFNYYGGDYRSRVAVNADVGHRMSGFPVLVAHECYPGHHTEHCRKELLLVRGDDQQEQTVFLVNTPQCVMAEGLGDLALAAAVGPGWGRWAAQVLDGIGPRFDADLVEELEVAARPLNSVRQDAAILLHDRGADPNDVLEYLQRWGLVDERRARQQLRFATDPLWRAYTSTYVEGERLLRPWLEARPAGQDRFDRFRRLLDEPLTPEVIRQELDAAGAGTIGTAPTVATAGGAGSVAAAGPVTPGSDGPPG